MLSPITTHVSLLARLAEGVDPTAWREFSERYGELIHNFGQRRGLQQADCDDLVQEVLLALTKAIQTFKYDPQKGRFRSYLKTITVRSIPRILRQKAGSTQLGDMERLAGAVEGDQAVEAAWEEEWRANHVRRAMRVVEIEFSGAQLRAFQRYAVENADAHGVAEVLHLTVNQVYQAKSRILKRLSELVQEQVEDEG